MVTVSLGFEGNILAKQEPQAEEQARFGRFINLCKKRFIFLFIAVSRVREPRTFNSKSVAPFSSL